VSSRNEGSLELADPTQGRLRITADRWLHQFVQGLENPRLLLGRGLSAGTFPTNPFAEPHCTRPEIMEAAADRAARNPGGLRDCRYPSPASGAGFTGREQAPIALIQEGLNGVKTGLDGGGVDHAAMVDAAFGFSPKPSASVCCFFAHFPIRLLRVAYFGSGPKSA